MLSDPQSVTIGATPVSLPRVSVGNRTATYASKDGSTSMTVSHVNGKRSRSVIRLDTQKIASDPANPSINKPYSMSTYLVVDTPLNVGYSDTEVADVVKALTGTVNAAGFLDKFLGQES